jgi:benzoate membrane transport protein
MHLEPPPAGGPESRLLVKSMRGEYAANAVIAFLFAITGPVAIVLTIQQQGRLTEADVASWLFGAFTLNGFVSLILCVLYRQPLVFLWTIPGTVLVGQALDHFTFSQVVGAYYATGLFMLVLGLSGLMRACMSRIPIPIIMAMVAGVFLQFGLDVIFSLRDGFLIAAPMTLAFLLLSANPNISRFLPPTVGALVCGAIAVALSHSFNLQSELSVSLVRPNVYWPEFSWAAMVELVLPLAVTVLAAQNAQGFAVLEASGHKPPVNMITAVCGLVSLLTAPFGAVPTCFTGPANAILVSSGVKERHYAAGVMMSILAVLFGLFSPVFTQVMLATPKVFVTAVAGLAFLRVLERAFVVSFSGAFTFGAAVSFLVTVADVPIFSIAAPFWALLAGFAVSWMLERKDFEKLTARQA